MDGPTFIQLAGFIGMCIIGVLLFDTLRQLRALVMAATRLLEIRAFKEMPSGRVDRH